MPLPGGSTSCDRHAMWRVPGDPAPRPPRTTGWPTAPSRRASCRWPPSSSRWAAAPPWATSPRAQGTAHGALPWSRPSSWPTTPRRATGRIWPGESSRCSTLRRCWAPPPPRSPRRSRRRGAPGLWPSLSALPAIWRQMPGPSTTPMRAGPLTSSTVRWRWWESSTQGAGSTAQSPGSPPHPPRAMGSPACGRDSRKP